MLSRLSSFIAFASPFFHTCSQFSLYSNGYTLAYRGPNSRHKKGRRLLPLRPVSGACCHHDSQTPAFTLLPVTPPADNRCGDNTRKDWGCQVVPEHHAKLHERHIAAYCHDNVSRLSLNCSGSRLAPVMLSGLRLTTCGGFLFPATNAAGDRAPATLRLTGRLRLGADSTSSALLTSFSECTRCGMLSDVSSSFAFLSPNLPYLLAILTGILRMPVSHYFFLTPYRFGLRLFLCMKVLQAAIHLAFSGRENDERERISGGWYFANASVCTG